LRKLLERFISVPDDKLPEGPVDVIVGIGAGLSRAYRSSWRSIVLSLQSERVLDFVTELFEKKKGRDIFFSGGYSYKGYYEAVVMYEKFLNSVNRKKIIYPHIETKSRNTLGNAVETIKWLKEKNYKSAIIVDFSGHLKQMKDIFLKQNKGTRIKLYFMNAHSTYGWNSQTRLNNFYSFFVWQCLTNIYYKMIGAL
jgi:hypothetical protein